MRMTVTINAPADLVWLFVADPVLMSAWNEKNVDIKRQQGGPVTLGESYQMTYVMKGNALASACEVVACKPPRELKIRCTMLDRPGRHVDECYTLTERDGQTHLVQLIDLRWSGIPRWALALIWFIQKTGKTQGTPYLKVLKTMAEEMSGGRMAA